MGTSREMGTSTMSTEHSQGTNTHSSSELKCFYELKIKWSDKGWFILGGTKHEMQLCMGNKIILWSSIMEACRGATAIGQFKYTKFRVSKNNIAIKCWLLISLPSLSISFHISKPHLKLHKIYYAHQHANTLWAHSRCECFQVSLPQKNHCGHLKSTVVQTAICPVDPIWACTVQHYHKNPLPCATTWFPHVIMYFVLCNLFQQGPGCYEWIITTILATGHMTLTKFCTLYRYHYNPRNFPCLNVYNWSVRNKKR